MKLLKNLVSPPPERTPSSRRATGSKLAQWFMVAGAVIVSLLGTNAHAQTLANNRYGAGLFQAGPLTRTDGFPLFYTSKGTAANAATQTNPQSSYTLEPCIVDPTVDRTDPCGLLIAGLAGVYNPALPISFPDNYPPETFYYRNTAKIPSVEPGNVKNLVWEVAIEGSFFPGPNPARGQNVTFARFRINAFSSLAPNTEYVLRHPYGDIRFVTDATGDFRTTSDEGCLGPPCGAFDQILTTQNVGGMMRAAVLPARLPAGQFLSTPGTEVPAVGSPIGRNQIEIYKVVNSVETLVTTHNTFDITGKVFDGPVPPYVFIDRSTYSLQTSSSTPIIEVFARSLPGATVTAVAGTASAQMTGDASGHFFASFPAGSATLVPTSVRVTAVANTATTVATSPITDHVVVDSAYYNTVTKGFSINAHSSDTPDTPVITVFNTAAPPVAIGTLTSNSLDIQVLAPPAVVRLVSSKGGVSTRALELVNGLLPSTTSFSDATGAAPNLAVTVDSGAPFSLTATVRNSGGNLIATSQTVVFLEGTKPLTGPIAQDPATLTFTGTISGLTTTPTAQHTITAAFAGDLVYGPSTSTASTVVTVRYPTSVTVTPATISGAVGTATTVTATVTTSGLPALTVGSFMRFYITNSAGNVTTSDVAVTSANAGTRAITLSWVPATAGTYSIAAAYLGDAQFSASLKSAAVTATVGAVASMNFSTLQTSYTLGQQFPVSVTLPTDAVGSVQFQIGATLWSATNNGSGVWSTNVNAPSTGGAFTITATYQPTAPSPYGSVTKTASSSVKFSLTARAVVVDGGTTITSTTTTKAFSQKRNGDFYAFVSAVGTSTLPAGSVTFASSGTNAACNFAIGTATLGTVLRAVTGGVTASIASINARPTVAPPTGGATCTVTMTITPTGTNAGNYNTSTVTNTYTLLP